MTCQTVCAIVVQTQLRIVSLLSRGQPAQLGLMALKRRGSIAFHLSCAGAHNKLNALPAGMRPRVLDSYRTGIVGELHRVVTLIGSRNPGQRGLVSAFRRLSADCHWTEEGTAHRLDAQAGYVELCLGRLVITGR